MFEERPVAASRPASGAGWLVWLLVLVFLVYPLSFGPAFKLVTEGELPQETLTLYDPLVMLATFEPVGDFFVWYIYDLWNAG